MTDLLINVIASSSNEEKPLAMKCIKSTIYAALSNKFLKEYNENLKSAITDLSPKTREYQNAKLCSAFGYQF